MPEPCPICLKYLAMGRPAFQATPVQDCLEEHHQQRNLILTKLEKAADYEKTFSPVTKMQELYREARIIYGIQP